MQPVYGALCRGHAVLYAVKRERPAVFAECHLQTLLLEVFRVIAPSAAQAPTILRERSYNMIIVAIQNYVENQYLLAYHG